MPVPVPRELADLPYAGYLQPFDGELDREGSHTEVHLCDTQFEDFTAANSDLRECAVTGVTFSNGNFDRTRFTDVWLRRTRWVGTSLAESNWAQAAVLESFLAGTEAYGATLRQVTFQECKIDTLNLRGATLRDVVFDRCDLREIDFGGATLTGVTFPGSALRQARFDRATLARVDLRGATVLDVASGYDSMSGATIDSGQLIALAPALAASLGIEVAD